MAFTLDINLAVFILVIILCAVVLIRLIRGFFKVVFTLFAVCIVFGSVFYAFNILQGNQVDIVGFLTGKISKEELVKQKELIIDHINQSVQDNDFKKVVSLVKG